MAGERCRGVPEFPGWASSSDRYRELFNTVAQEMNLGIAWTQDAAGGAANVPEAERGEVEIAPEARQRYGLDGPAGIKVNPLFSEDICKVTAEIERRRRFMAKAGIDVFPAAESGTFTHHKLDALSPAERRWMETVAPAFADEAHQIYGLQAVPQFLPTQGWMDVYADDASQYHYHRILSSLIPEGDGNGFADPEKYASSVPWFPRDSLSSGHLYGMMWPVDFTKAELDHINAHYGEDDPIRLPYTVVSRIDAAEAARIERSPAKDGKAPVEWVRTGPDGKRYRVVNMAFDEQMRPHFQRIASLLRAKADIAEQGSTLGPAFRGYTLEMADALEHGDFPRLLRADMAQKGRIFLTFFPHEGYWACNTKYPFMFEVGVKDSSLDQAVAKQGYAVAWLGKEIEGIAREAGLSAYRAPKFDPAAVVDSTAFFWPVRAAAFMRIHERDPGGHDYPKRTYAGIEGHRVVMLLDVLETWAPRTASVAEATFGKEIAGLVSPESFSKSTFWHEVGHGAQLRPEVKTLSGKPVSSAFGNLWGVLVEPWADAGVVLAYDRLRRDGKVSEQEFREVVLTDILYSAVRLQPRAKALSDDVISGAPHYTGSGMYLGWLYNHGAIVRGKGALLAFDEAKIVPAARKFVERLATIAAKGDAKALDAFMRECVAMIPEDLEKQIVAKKAAATPYRLIDRGDLEPMPKG